MKNFVGGLIDLIREHWLATLIIVLFAVGIISGAYYLIPKLLSSADESARGALSGISQNDVRNFVRKLFIGFALIVSVLGWLSILDDDWTDWLCTVCGGVTLWVLRDMVFWGRALSVMNEMGFVRCVLLSSLIFFIIHFATSRTSPRVLIHCPHQKVTTEEPEEEPAET